MLLLIVPLPGGRSPIGVLAPGWRLPIEGPDGSEPCDPGGSDGIGRASGVAGS